MAAIFSSHLFIIHYYLFIAALGGFAAYGNSGDQVGSIPLILSGVLIS